MPRILTEDETLERALAGTSLSRFGDGEMRLAVRGGCSSQENSPQLANELRQILTKPGPVLPCIPRLFDGMGNQSVWETYVAKEKKYSDLYTLSEYGSAFITRPDTAHHIDTPTYWNRVISLWEGEDVVLVHGDNKSLTPDVLKETGAKEVRSVIGPARHAYAVIEQIEEEVGRPGIPILLCLGACATVLAARLANKGEFALDLGHIGMFMRHSGAFATPVGKLASKSYRKMLQKYHSMNRWGTGGWKTAGEIIMFRDELGARSILDYGCGEGTLARALAPIRVSEYDPGIAGKDQLPKPAELVVCGDVLEHVELDYLDAVLKHIWVLAGKGAFLTIAMFPAEKKLPDGRDLHLILKDPDWWLERLKANNYNIDRHETRGRTLYVWAKK